MKFEGEKNMIDVFRTRGIFLKDLIRGLMEKNNPTFQIF